MVELIQVEERIQRSIYEAIRVELVARGYLPDISDNLLYPNTKAGQEAFQQAMSDITDARGFCVELFSTGALKARGLKKVPRIVIQKGRLLPGDIGSSVGNSYQPDGAGGFIKVELPPHSTNMFLSIHLVSNEEGQDRVMNNVIGNAISVRRYLPLLDAVEFTDRFLILQVGYNENNDMDEGIMERIYEFSVPDLYITEKKEVGIISAITEITLEQSNIPNTDSIQSTTPNP